MKANNLRLRGLALVALVFTIVAIVGLLLCLWGGPTWVRSAPVDVASVSPSPVEEVGEVAAREQVAASFSRRELVVEGQRGPLVVVRLFAENGIAVPVERDDSSGVIRVSYHSSRPVVCVVVDDGCAPWFGWLTESLCHIGLEPLASLRVVARTRSGSVVGGLGLTLESKGDVAGIDVATIQRFFLSRNEERESLIADLLKDRVHGNRFLERPLTVRTDRSGEAVFQRVVVNSQKCLLVRTARPLSVADAGVVVESLALGWRVSGFAHDADESLELILADGAKLVGSVNPFLGAEEGAVTVRMRQPVASGEMLVVEAEVDCSFPPAADGVFEVDGLGAGAKWVSLRWRVGSRWYLASRDVNLDPDSRVDMGPVSPDSGVLEVDMSRLPEGRFEAAIGRVLGRGGVGDVGERLVFEHPGTAFVEGLPDGRYFWHFLGDSRRFDAPAEFDVVSGVGRMVVGVSRDMWVRLTGASDGERVRMVMHSEDLARSTAISVDVRDGGVRAKVVPGMRFIRLELRRSSGLFVAMARMEGLEEAHASLAPAAVIVGRIARGGRFLGGEMVDVLVSYGDARSRFVVKSDANGEFKVGPMPVGSLINVVGCQPASHVVREGDAPVVFERF